MPIYEYGCQKCKKKTEAIQRVGEAPLKICPHCGGQLKKLFSAPAIQFKGSGWYITDYARAKKEEKSASSGKGETSEKGATSQKGETSEKGEASEKREASGKGESSEKSETSERRETSEKSGEKAGEKTGEKKKDTKEKKTAKE